MPAVRRVLYLCRNLPQTEALIATSCRSRICHMLGPVVFACADSINHPAVSSCALLLWPQQRIGQGTLDLDCALLT